MNESVLGNCMDSPKFCPRNGEDIREIIFRKCAISPPLLSFVGGAELRIRAVETLKPESRELGCLVHWSARSSVFLC